MITKFAEIDDNVSELIVCNFVHWIHSAAQVYYWPNCSVHWATGKLTNWVAIMCISWS